MMFETTSAVALREAALRLVDAAETETSPMDDSERVELLLKLLGPAACRQLGIFRVPAGFVLSVVIPVYNEVKTVAEVIRKVRTCGLPTEIILVDDGSKDGTRELLNGWRDQKDLKIIFHEKNQGKGAALKTGFQHATGSVVIVQDADLEYDPGEFPQLVQPIIEGQADVVFGSRFKGETNRVLYFWHSIGNYVLTLLSNMMTNLNLTDMETCYKAFHKDVIGKIAPTLEEQRFGTEPELTAKVASLPEVRIYERPISYRGRTYAEGKKITWKDGFRALYCIWKYRKGMKRYE
jgi:glycosyltransferase involved in cell wall biosynthesis